MFFAWKDTLIRLSPGYQERRPYQVQNHLQPLLLTDTTVKTIIFHPFYISFYCNPWQLMQELELDLKAQEFNLYYSCYFCIDFFQEFLLLLLLLFGIYLEIRGQLLSVGSPYGA